MEAKARSVGYVSVASKRGDHHKDSFFGVYDGDDCRQSAGFLKAQTVASQPCCESPDLAVVLGALLSR